MRCFVELANNAAMESHVLNAQFLYKYGKKLCQLLFENMSSIQVGVYIEGQPHYYQVKHDAHSVMQTFHITNPHKFHIKNMYGLLECRLFLS